MGSRELWDGCASPVSGEYQELYDLLATENNRKLFNINNVGQASSLLNTSTTNPISLSSSLENVGQDAQPTKQDAQPTKQDAQSTGRNSGLKITYRNWGKLPHWELNGSIYFITFNTIERSELTSEARQIVLDACLFFNNQRYELYTAVIMPDHVHLLIQPIPKEDRELWTLASILHSIKSYTAKQLPKVMNHIGTVWQDSRYDRIIRDEREFLDTWEYIRQNPVKANLSLSPEDYPFLWQSQNLLGLSSFQPVKI